jgi:hypothetical protein
MVSLLIVVIVTAIAFDFINGFHDAANAIATVVSTGVLPVRTAVLVAGLFNFIGAITGTAVAKTIASGFADPAIVVQAVVLAALLGAITWNLITWWYGIPSRYAEGGVPVRRWKSSEKLPKLENPTSRHALVTVTPAASSVFARSTRTRVRTWCGVSPNRAANMRMK